MIHHQATFDRDLPAQYDGVFMWDFLKGVFGPSIMPTDFDGVVERHGHFLVFETKDIGARPTEGQEIAFRALVADPRFTVLICRKRPEQIRGWTVWTRRGLCRFLGDAEALKAWCAAWYEDKEHRARETR